MTGLAESKTTLRSVCKTHPVVLLKNRCTVEMEQLSLKTKEVRDIAILRQYPPSTIQPAYANKSIPSRLSHHSTMVLHFDSHSNPYPYMPSRHVGCSSESLALEDDDQWSAPLVPGLFDLDPCAPSPVKMTSDFEPLHYECKKLGQKSIPPTIRAQPAPRLISSEWSAPESTDVGLGIFESETQHIEGSYQQPPRSSVVATLNTPSPIRPYMAQPPLAAVPSPSLLRAPRLPHRPLLSSPSSPLISAVDSETPAVIPPIEGTRPPAATRFSALGLDLTAAAPVEACLPSPPASTTAGRGRCRPRASTIERSQYEERGRTRERGRRTEVDDDLPDLTYSHDERRLHARVSNWSTAVAAATHSCPSTPPEAAPLSLPIYDEIELAIALGRLNADAVGPSPIPSASLPQLQAPRLIQRATSFQPEELLHETVQQNLAAEWAARVGQSRGRLFNIPQLQRASTMSSVQRLVTIPRESTL